MDWNDFFRPTKLKIGIIVALLVLLFLFVGMIGACCMPGSRCFIGCPQDAIIVFWPSLLFQSGQIFDAFSVFSIIWLYFLSCLIVFVYRKFRK